MFYKNLELTSNEVKFRLNRNFVEDIRAAYDMVEQEI